MQTRFLPVFDPPPPPLPIPMPRPENPPPRIFKLRNGIKTYEWGKRGSASLVGRLATHVTCNGIKMDEDENYAELWMGTHPSAPSYALLNFQPVLLSDLLRKDQTLVGPDALISKFPGLMDGQLPFLFKVLSCGKALPLQAHPDKALARRLFEKDKRDGQEEFVDDNHKPEIAVCVESYEGFVGFLPHDDILKNIATYIPRSTLEDVLGGKDDCRTLLETLRGKIEAERTNALQSIFARFLEMKKDVVESVVHHILQSNKSESKAEEDQVVNLVRRLNEQYPGDPGAVITPLSLNYVKLDPGEAVYAEADGIHAWLSGDMIECMATSDNVVNAAFAPENPKDVETFKSMLTYRSQPSESFHVSCQPFSGALSTHHAEHIPGRCKGFTKLLRPPLPEFSVLRCKLPFEGSVEVMDALEGPSIIITVSGHGKLCAEGFHRRLDYGESWFVAPWVETKFTAGEDGWEFYRAFVEP